MRIQIWHFLTVIRFGVLAAVTATSLVDVHASTNGFLIPPFRGTTNSQWGYWETFTVAFGPPGNLPDQPGATTTAVLTQTGPNAILTGSGNIYNFTDANTFIVSNTTPYLLGTVVFQTSTLGSEIDYSSVSLNYVDVTGTHTMGPLFRYELARANQGSQGAAVSSLWEWNLAGLGVTSYSITFAAAGSSLSFDAMTLDTANQFAPVFWQQPFVMGSAPADLARWNYLASDFGLQTRATASVFGAVSDAPGFDARDAQYLLGWNTTNRIPAGQGARNYLISRARVTLTIASGGQYAYTGVLRDYRTYFPTDDPRYIPPATNLFPVELYGAGFRGNFTNGNNVVIPWASTNYPQTGPWGVAPDVYYTNRIAYAAGFDTNGILVDVSNNIGDDGTNEIAAPFEVAPFAVGQSADVPEGALMPANSQLTFDLNLEDPQIYGYLQNGLNQGNLILMASSLVTASQSGPATFPSFYTIFSSIAETNQFPLLDIQGEIVRPNVDNDGDGLADDWENFYFGRLGVGATNSFNGDAVNNLAKYIAGTNPTNSADNFRLLSIQDHFGAAELHFNFAPNRQYSINWSDDLLHWQSVTNPALNYLSAWLTKTAPNVTYPAPVYAVWTDTNAGNGQRFYRVSAQ